METEEQKEQISEERETDTESQTTETSTDSSTPQKTNSLPMVLLVLVILVVVGFVAFKGMKSVKSSEDNSTGVQEQSASPSAVPSQTPSGPVKEFTVDGSNFKFSPNKITVKKGDNVKITFKDDDGFHNLVVDGYNVKTNTIQSGNSDSVTFVADKIGTFQYYCAVDSHRQKGMVGTLVVQ